MAYAHGGTGYAGLVTSSPGTETDYTVCVWAYINAYPASLMVLWQSYAGNNDYDVVTLNSTGTINYQAVRGSSTVASVTAAGVAIQQWVFVTCTSVGVDGEIGAEGEIELFLDGVSEGNDIYTSTGVVTSVFYVGSLQGSLIWDGDTDCIKTYDSVLSANEQNKVMHRRWYPFDQPTHMVDPVPGDSSSLTKNWGSNGSAFSNVGCTLVDNVPQVPFIGPAGDEEVPVPDINIELSPAVCYVRDVPAIGLTVGAVSVELTSAETGFFAPLVGLESGPILGVSAIELLSAESRVHATSILLDAVYEPQIDTTNTRIVVANPELQPGAVSIALEPAVSKARATNVELTVDAASSVGLTATNTRILVRDPQVQSGPVSVSLQPAVFSAVETSPALVSGAVSIALPAVSMSATVGDPEVSLGAVSLQLDPSRATFDLVSPSLSTGASTVFLMPATASVAASDVGLTEASTITNEPAVAQFVVPAVALQSDVGVLISPATGTFDVPELELVGAQATDISIEPAVVQFVVPFPGQRSEVVLTPTTARFSVPALRLIGVVTLRDKIACVLTDEARDGEFYVVNTNPNTGKTSTGVSTEVDSIETLTNEVDSNFNLARRHRRTFRDERQTWTWRLVLGFNNEVTIERFEDSLVRNPRVIPRDRSLGFPQVTLRLRQTLYDHPVQQDSNRGTRAILTFDAELAPV